MIPVPPRAALAFAEAGLTLPELVVSDSRMTIMDDVDVQDFMLYLIGKPGPGDGTVCVSVNKSIEWTDPQGTVVELKFMGLLPSKL